MAAQPLAFVQIVLPHLTPARSFLFGLTNEGAVYSWNVTKDG